MAATWRRCETCRKVLSVDEFDGDATSCVACGRKAERAAARSGPTAVTTRRVPAAAAKASQADSSFGSGGPRRGVSTGVVGRGDREVRSRRARSTALDQLAELHAADFERLLEAARKAEGLI